MKLKQKQLLDIKINLRVHFWTLLVADGGYAAVRDDPEVVAYFKGTGAGWHTRMNEVLCEWVAKRGSA